VAREAVFVHRVRAENRLAVMAAHHPHSPRGAKEGASDRVDARRADVKRPGRLRLSFLRTLTSGIMEVGQLNLRNEAS
jgi:hypothetical protein